MRCLFALLWPKHKHVLSSLVCFLGFHGCTEVMRFSYQDSSLSAMKELGGLTHGGQNERENMNREQFPGE